MPKKYFPKLKTHIIKTEERKNILNIQQQRRIFLISKNENKKRNLQTGDIQTCSQCDLQSQHQGRTITGWPAGRLLLIINYKLKYKLNYKLNYKFGLLCDLQSQHQGRTITGWPAGRLLEN